ncbi:MAG: helix-hairpin-helix domain-containing protein [Sulfuricellaceae bacterium]|nr:helix-hairpin-helix domain-containing protein [Sulfuricellaceae bacterium]
MKKLLLALFACFTFMGMAQAAEPVDLNSATSAQLESVNGIGPAKAQAIIAYRTKNGPFKSVNDLEKVDGFGKKSVDNMRKEITVKGAAPTKADVKASDAKATATKAADVKQGQPK